MTLEEFEKRLRELTSEELHKFNNDFGGGQHTIEQLIRVFVESPQYERRLCHLLKLKTEAEKTTAATIESADAATLSAAYAKKSMLWSVIACITAIVAVIVSIAGLFIKR